MHYPKKCLSQISTQVELGLLFLPPIQFIYVLVFFIANFLITYNFIEINKVLKTLALTQVSNNVRQILFPNATGDIYNLWTQFTSYMYTHLFISDFLKQKVY